MRAAILIGAAMVILAGTAAAAPTAAGAEDTKAAQAVVTRWLDAQNQGDWKAYEALYAPAFTGVRRVGTQVKKLDRAGWLKDRKVMFKAKMKVSATNVAVTTDGSVYTVELDQRWEQGSYADVGRKRIVIGRADLLIASEELVTSRLLLTAPACVKALYPDAKRGRIGPGRDADELVDTAVLDLGGDRFVCRVDHAAKGSPDTTVDLAAVGRGKGWTLLGQREESIKNETEPGGTAGTRGTVELKPVVLSPTVTGVLVTVSASIYDDVTDNTKESAALYLVDADGFQEQLTFESISASDVETSDGTSCALAVGKKLRKGMPDLDVTCTTRRGDWYNEDPDQRGEKTTDEVTHYRWDGTTYAEK